MYVTSRAAMTSSTGGRRASCTYFPEDVPGMLGMQLSTENDTDAERFFQPFEKNFDNIKTIDGLGDRAEAVAYSADGTKTHYVEIRTIAGDRGLHLFYSYQDGGGAMPKADGTAAAKILDTALNRLPTEVTIPGGTPEGGCADLDLAPVNEAMGTELTFARSVLSTGDAMSCYFSGEEATSVDITVVTDPTRAQQARVTPDAITHPDIGDGAKLLVTEANTLDARVNLGDKLLAITANYGETTVSEQRPEDVELVRTVADTIDE